MSRRVSAFLKKDFLIESSYKLAFLCNILAVLFSVLAYFFIDKLFGYKIVAELEEFGVNYFSYVLLGMAFFSYVGSGLGSFSRQIHNEQMQGTLEAVLLTPIKVSTLLFSMVLWNLIFATLETAIYIILGKFFFKINFTNVNLVSALVILILTIASFSALGILSASFVMVFKRSNPFGWILNSVGGLIGGVYFPIAVLPQWLQFLAQFLPITYAIRAMELAVYRGASLVSLKKEVGFLLFFSVILLPLCVSYFKYALNKARRQGSLSFY